jgi:hypothetical protein
MSTTNSFGSARCEALTGSMRTAHMDAASNTTVAATAAGSFLR